MKCDCLENDCHHVYGCENVSAGYFLLIENTLTLHMCNLHNFQIDKVFPINAKKTKHLREEIGNRSFSELNLFYI